jgi:hypothetical protein
MRTNTALVFALSAAAALLASTQAATAAADCLTKLERLVEARKEGKKTIHVCVCKDGYVRDAATKQCVRAKKLQTRVSGDVTLQTWDGKTLSADDLRRASADAKMASVVLASGNVVKTGADGAFEVKLSDGAALSLGAGTSFKIDKAEFDKSGEQTVFVTTLEQGILRLNSGIGYAKAQTKRTVYRERYCIPIHYTCVGRRGTNFEMTARQTPGGKGACLDASGACAPTASGEIKLHDGSIDIYGKDGEVLLTMQAGQRVVIDSAGAVIGPVPIDPAQ